MRATRGAAAPGRKRTRGPRRSPAKRVRWGDEMQWKECALPLAVKRAIRNLCRRCRPWALGSRVEGAGGAFDENPREATSKNAGPGGFPTAFDSKSGAPAGQARAPGVPRPTGAHTGAPLRQTRRPEEGVGRRVKDAAPYDSGRTKWARGSGRSHGTTCPAARERGTSMSRW